MEVRNFTETVVTCVRCGQRNRVFRVHRRQGFRCGQCHAALDNPFALPNQAMIVLFEHPWRTGAATFLCGIMLLGGWALQSRKAMRDLEARLANELIQYEAAHHANLKSNAAAHSITVSQETQRQKQQTHDEMARHRELLADAALLSGEKARLRHEEEWSRRSAYASDFAATAIEKVMLQMHQAASDKELPMDMILQQVALLASPVGSRAQVTRRDGRMFVKVAFRMSALSSKETGAVTTHTSKESLRAEAIALCARVMRDIYEHCGARDIDQVQLSCNHAVRQALVSPFAPESDKIAALSTAPVVWTVLYRCSLAGRAAEKMAKWHDASLASVRNMLVVEQDKFPTLSISGRSTGWFQSDPAAPLEFE